jgi:hypothetical protein
MPTMRSTNEAKEPYVFVIQTPIGRGPPETATHAANSLASFYFLFPTPNGRGRKRSDEIFFLLTACVKHSRGGKTPHFRGFWPRSAGGRRAVPAKISDDFGDFHCRPERPGPRRLLDKAAVKKLRDFLPIRPAAWTACLPAGRQPTIGRPFSFFRRQGGKHRRPPSPTTFKPPASP